ncbi:hypothetical protein V8F20_003177 [Naviculisporaceae sp. PSN 640]
MKFSVAIVAALVSAVYAAPSKIVARQNSPECDAAVEQVPECGRGCILDAAAKLGYSPDDFADMCGDFAKVRSGASICVLTKCGLKATEVLSAATTACDVCQA